MQHIGGHIALGGIFRIASAPGEMLRVNTRSESHPTHATDDAHEGVDVALRERGQE